MAKKGKAVSNVLTINPEQAHDIIAWCMEYRKVSMMVGRPGIGKTDIYGQAAQAAKNKFYVFHPVVDDPTDYKGLPWVTKLRNGTLEDRPRAEFVPIGMLRDLVETAEPTFALLDDFGQAPPATQAAAMQLLLSRSLNGQPISDYVTFGIATNRREDKAAVSGILEPVKSRCLGGIYHLEPSVESWVKWAIRAKMPPWVTSFVRFKPQHLTDWEPTQDLVNTACPRTIAGVGDAVNNGLDRDLWLPVFTGIAGQGFAMECIAFHDIYSKLPNPDSILQDPEKAPIPDDIAIQFALTGALAAKTTKQNFKYALKYFDRWYKGEEFSDGIPHAEFVLAYFKDAIARNEELQRTDEFVKWSTDHADDYY